MFSKTKISLSRMDIFAVGEEFTDGKNRLKPQCGVEQISLAGSWGWMLAEQPAE